MVQRIWKADDLKPHRVRTFKLSNDPRLLEKLEDVVGLYLRRRRRGSSAPTGRDFTGGEVATSV